MRPLGARRWTVRQIVPATPPDFRGGRAARDRCEHSDERRSLLLYEEILGVVRDPG